MLKPYSPKAIHKFILNIDINDCNIPHGDGAESIYNQVTTALLSDPDDKSNCHAAKIIKEVKDVMLFSNPKTRMKNASRGKMWNNEKLDSLIIDFQKEFYTKSTLI